MKYASYLGIVIGNAHTFASAASRSLEHDGVAHLAVLH